MNKQIAALVGLTIFLYVVLTACGAVERYVAVAVGSHSSPGFAAEIQHIDTLRSQQLKDDPAEAARVGHRIILARRGARAGMAFLFSAFMVWFPKFARSRGISHEPQRA
jgi:hypothetical protein